MFQLFCYLTDELSLRKDVKANETAVCVFVRVCVTVVLTGGPAGPGGPLLSWVQVQDLGRAGQSASFLWTTAPPRGRGRKR